jgi:hypothetical protein
MYRLTPYDSNKAEQFYQKYAPAIWRRVDYWLNQGTKQVVLEGRDTKAGRTADIVLNVRVEPGSATDTFLRAVQKPIYLHWLMTFTPDHLDCVVDKILGMFPPEQRVLASKKLNRTIFRFFYQGQTDIDHFHTIVYDVFVDSVFDGEENGSPVFDRQWFCRKVGAVICPYCGAEDITTSPVNRQAGVTYVKPDVDHFLPKSQYPYLAMSYANLIPCSVTCNRSRKHTFDPIASLNPLQYKLMLPYLFDEQRLRFYYDIDNGNYLSADAYQVKIDYYGDVNLEEGYSRQMGIDGLYATKGYMLKDLYVSMSGVSEDYVRLMATMGVQVKASDIHYKPSIVTFIGHPDTEEASGKYPYHKFYKDMAGQMINDGNCGWCW